MLDALDLHVQVLFLLEQLSEVVLVLKLVRDEGVELLGGVILDELD